MVPEDQAATSGDLFPLYTDWCRLKKLAGPEEYHDISRRMEAMLRFMNNNPVRGPYRAPV